MPIMTDIHTLPCVLSVTSLWRQSLQTNGMNLTSVLLTRRPSSGSPAYSLRRGQRWPLWAQTLKTIVYNDRLHERFTFCKKICYVLTILHQLICMGVANFGTRCVYCTAGPSVTYSSQFIMDGCIKRCEDCGTWQSAATSENCWSSHDFCKQRCRECAQTLTFTFMQWCEQDHPRRVVKKI